MGNDSRGFAPVAPIQILQYLYIHGVLGYYNLVLAHDVLKHPKEYAALADNWGTWIIDNSVIELNHPIDPETILRARDIYVEAIQRDHGKIVTVLPDELLEGNFTKHRVNEALEVFQKHHVDNLMLVPQGTTIEEVVDCAEEFQGIPQIKWIGVARNLTYSLGSRREITEILRCIFPECDFHMLGFSRNTTDDILCTRLPGIYGIDSSMPLRLTEPIEWFSRFPKRGDWWSPDLKGTPLMVENIKRVRQWLSNV